VGELIKVAAYLQETKINELKSQLSEKIIFRHIRIAGSSAILCRYLNFECN